MFLNLLTLAQTEQTGQKASTVDTRLVSQWLTMAERSAVYEMTENGLASYLIQRPEQFVQEEMRGATLVCNSNFNT